ncbi:864_t:CDS:2, partial [Gigaspora rosea]
VSSYIFDLVLLGPIKVFVDFGIMVGLVLDIPGVSLASFSQGGRPVFVCFRGPATYSSLGLSFFTGTCVVARWLSQSGALFAGPSALGSS